MINKGQFLCKGEIEGGDNIPRRAEATRQRQMGDPNREEKINSQNPFQLVARDDVRKQVCDPKFHKSPS